MFNTVDTKDIDEPTLNRQLDKVKAAVFMSKDAAFFGSIMCSLNFQWSRDVATVATNGIHLWWNPDFFMALAQEARHTVLKHELWHVARLHPVRISNRRPKEWNWACDIRINNDLEKQGNSFLGIEECWKNHDYDSIGSENMAEEDIYDLIVQNQLPPPPKGSFSGTASQGIPGEDDGDLMPLTPTEQQQVVNSVVQAVQQAKLSGQPGAIPGGVEETLSHFLEPVVSWERLLMKFFTDMLDEDYSWKRPNRRYTDMYLPSRFTDDGRLEHLMYFLDVSGSISSADALRFNSEVKFIQDVLCPEKLTLVQFDTKIQKVDEFVIGQPFDEIKIVGRGGTCLRCVREYIEEHRPTAAVIFSDMYVEPMQKPSIDVPIIWAILGNSRATVPFGSVIHIDPRKQHDHQ